MELTFKYRKIVTDGVECYLLLIDHQRIQRKRGEAYMYLWGRLNFRIMSINSPELELGGDGDVMTLYVKGTATEYNERVLSMSKADFDTVRMAVMDFNQMYSNNRISFDDVFTEDETLEWTDEDDRGNDDETSSESSESYDPEAN